MQESLTVLDTKYGSCDKNKYLIDDFHNNTHVDVNVI